MHSNGGGTAKRRTYCTPAQPPVAVWLVKKPWICHRTDLDTVINTNSTKRKKCLLFFSP